MKPKNSILSGGKARELLAQLNKKQPTKRATTFSNYANLDLSLRYCYRTEHIAWNQKGFMYKTRIVLTGGMVLAWQMRDIEREYSIIASGEIRIKRDSDMRQEKAVSRAIHRILRMTKYEQLRVEAVRSLDKIVKPLEGNDKFLDFVDKYEKQDGKTSDYVLLTREDCEKWGNRVKDYMAA